MSRNKTLPTRLPCLRARLLCGLLFASLSGCMLPGEPDPMLTRMDDLQASLDSLHARLAEAEAEKQSLEQADALNLANVNAQLQQLQAQLDQMPETVSALCTPPSAPVTAECETQPVQTVVVAGDKLVVGELERVWIDPPEAQMEARIDTGASSSSLHAENVVEFERDGEDWVRFDIELDDETVTLERDIVRHVRVYQQADPEGTRRPVVTLRVRLGDLSQRVEFTLADRSHLDFEMILGRNFLTDVALVDVGKQYVQPPVKQKRAQ